MIQIHGEGKKVEFITLQKKGGKIKLLHEKSDPKDLYSALVEMSRMIHQLHLKSK